MSEWGVSLPQFASTLMDYGAYLGKTRENPDPRSSQYKRQSPFEGSVRQMRGRVLSYLAAMGTLTSNLYCGLDLPPDRIDPVLASLAAEGFIVMDGDTVKNYLSRFRSTMISHRNPGKNIQGCFRVRVQPRR